MFSKIFRGNRKIFLIFALVFLNFLIVFPSFAQNYVPLVSIPGINPNASLTAYLSGLYNFLISVVGILAMAVLVYGGLRYLTSAGNSAAAEDARDIITSAIYGLILALVSWLILNTINPDILVLKKPGVGLPSGKYSYNDSSNSCVRSPLGTGTKENPCQCIDGARVAATGAGLTATNLTLTISPNPASTSPPGNNVTFSGNLTDGITAAGLASKAVKINRVNTTLNASTTLNVTTDPSGNFSFNFTATCATGALPDQVQAVFDGDATYAPSSNNSVAFTVGGVPICVYPGNYLTSPAVATSGGGSFCNQVCSNKTLAAEKMNPDGSWVADGTYHCLVAGVRIGWVANHGAYTDEKLRAMATNFGTDAFPFIATEGATYIIEMEKYSTVLSTPAIYRMDTNYNGICNSSDSILNGAGGGWAKVLAYYADPPPVICKLSATPKATNCSQKLCVEDSMGNIAEITLYSTVIAK